MELLKGIHRPIIVGVIGAIAFTIGAIFPLYIMLPITMVACFLIITSAILKDKKEARNART